MAGETPLGRMVIDVDLNTTKLNNSVTGLQRQMKMVNTAMTNNLSSIGKYGSETDRVGAKVEGLTKKQKIQEGIVREQQEAYKKVVKEKGAASKEAEVLASKLNKEESALSNITNELKDMERQHQVMTSPWTRLSNGLDTYGNKLKSIGDQTMQAGKTGMKWITAPAVALGTIGVKSAMDYEYAMSNVKGLLNATDEDMRKLDESAKKWGGSTSYSATEVADAFGYMSLAGWDVEQQTQSIGGALKFTEATGLDLAHGVDLVTDSMGALGIETSDLGGYLDSLVATQSNSNTTAEEMMEAYIRAGSTMNAMNFTVDETNAMLGVLADNGIKGSEAGTKLNSMFAKMVNPTGQTAKAFEELGISMANADGTMKSSDEILAEIKSKTDGLTDSEKNRYIAMIAGTENLASMNTLLDSSGGKLEEYTKLNEESNGALDELHKIMKDNLKGDFEEFISSLEATALAIGEQLLPYVRDAIQWLTEMVNKFNGMSDSTKTVILAIGGIAAAIPPVLVGVGGFISIIGGVMRALSPLALAIANKGGLLKALGWAFKGLTGPVGIAVTVVGLIVSAFMIAYNKSETFRDAVHNLGTRVKETFNQIKEKTTELWEKIKTFGDGIKSMFQGDDVSAAKILTELGITPHNVQKLYEFRDKVVELKDRIVQTAQEISERVKPVLEDVMRFVGEVGDTLKQMWQDNSATIIPVVTNIGGIITSVFNGILTVIDFIMPAVFFIIDMVWQNIQGVIKGGLKVIDGAVKLFSGIFTGDFSKMWEGVKKIFSGAIQLVWNGFQLLFYGRIIKGVGSLVKLFGSSIKGLWTKVVGFFKGMYDDVSLRVMLMKDAVVNFIKQLAKNSVSAVKNLVTRVKDFFVDMYKNTTKRAGDLRNKVSDLFGRLRTKVVDTVKNLIDRVKNFFGDMHQNVTNRVGNLRSRVSDIFSGLRRAVVNTVKNLIDGVKRFFSNLYDSVRNTVGNLRQSVVDLFGRMRTGVTDGVSRMKERVSKLFGDIKEKASDIFKDMVKGAKELPGKLGNAISNGKQKAVDGIKKMGNSMITQLEKVVNGLIKGLNNITNKIGITATISEWNAPKFSTGTGGSSSLTKNGAIAKDTLATVGDRGVGNGTGTRELVEYPNGRVGLYDNDATIFAPKGTIIHSNRQTEAIINSLPQFSKGTGSGTKEGNKNKKKGLIGTMKDVLSNTWDYIKNPSKAFNAIIDNISPDFSGLKGFAGTVAKGGFNFVKDKALDWITGIFKDNESGQVDGKGILSKAITARFGRYPAGINFNGGRHYGLDTAHINDPLGSPVSGKVNKIWNDYGGGKSIQIKSGDLTWWFMHMSSIAKKVGDMVKVGDRLGVTGNTGNFTTGHHLHTQVMKGGVGNRFAFDPLPLLKKNGFATGGLVGNGIYRLGEEGYPEWVIPTDPKRRTDAQKLLAHAGKTLQNNNGSLRPNNLPNPTGNGGSNNDVAELREMVKNQQTQIEQTNKMLEALTMIAEKEYVALYNEKKMARDLAPELDKRNNYKTDRDARFS